MLLDAYRVSKMAKDHLMKYISHSSGDPDLTYEKKLPKLLLDLANYEYEEMVQHSLLLLDRYYSSESDIFQKALQTQLLLTEKSVALYNILDKKMVIGLTGYLKPNSESHHWSPVKELTNYCWLEGEVAGYEPHHINQRIILSFGNTLHKLNNHSFFIQCIIGFLSDILDYLSYHSSHAFKLEEENKKLIECFYFLRALTCKNEKVQKRLHGYMMPL